MKPRHNNFFFGIFLLLGISHPGFTAVYKWVDENGKTHYSDKPVNQQTETIDIKTKSPTQDTSQEDRKLTREKMLKIYEEEREQKKEEQAKAKEERKLRKQDCKNLQIELKDYKRGDSRLYELDENGDRYFLTDQDIKERISYLEQEIDKVCLKKWLN